MHGNQTLLFSWVQIAFWGAQVFGIALTTTTACQKLRPHRPRCVRMAMRYAIRAATSCAPLECSQIESYRWGHDKILVGCWRGEAPSLVTLIGYPSISLPVWKSRASSRIISCRSAVFSSLIRLMSAIQDILAACSSVRSLAISACCCWTRSKASWSQTTLKASYTLGPPDIVTVESKC